MSATKVCLVCITVAVLCVTSSVVADTVESISRQTAVTQQGSAVIFFVSHEGQLRDLLFNPIIFDQVVVNQGSAYNKNTGMFTAPMAGIYQFVFTAQLCRGNHNNSWYYMVNGETKMSCIGQVSGGDTTRHTCYFIEELQSGDQVWMRQKEDSCAWASSTSRTINFSGTLLSSQGVSRLGTQYRSCPVPGPGKALTSGSEGPTLTAPGGVTIPLLLCWLLLD